jgi:lysine 2,3-aminomutase
VDPLGETECSPAAGLVRRYRDRALLLATRRCFIQCAFCTRRGFVLDDGRSGLRVDPDSALGYLRRHPEIREVLVSGGDPLTLGDGELSALLDSLRDIPHVRLLRLATRAPMARPGRVTGRLVRLLASHGPLVTAVHFNHPAELTHAARRACGAMVDAGIPLINQTVLLSGVNDDADVLEELCFELAAERIRPYYILSCDRVAGTERFWVDLERAIALTSRLARRLPGHAVPTFVIDLPGRLGKARPGSGLPMTRVPGGWSVRPPSGEEVFYPERGPAR